MKKVAVVFHSVCGNTMLMAKQYEQAFLDEGHPVALFRVKDDNYNELCMQFPSSREIRKEMETIPVISDASDLVDYKVIVMGSPVYYGNVSAAMKAFMDSFSVFYKNSVFYGKYFLAFAAGENMGGGVTNGLMAMITFALHQGMVPIPVPPRTGMMPAYGCVHYSGANADKRPTMEVDTAIRKHVYSAAMVVGDELL